MEKTPSPFSSLPSRRVSLCPAHEWVLRSPPLSIHSVPFPLASSIPRAIFISPSPSASVGSFLDSPFYMLPTPSPRYLNPRRPARHSGGPQHQPVGSRPCFASFRFVSSLELPYRARPCTALREEDTRRRKWRVSRRSLTAACAPSRFP